MGITGLIPMLKIASVNVNLDDFGGSVAIIDAYCWLHRAGSGCFVDLYNKKDTDMYVKYCMTRIEHLKKVGIKSILVFDGQNLPSKEHTEANRKK